MSLPLIRATIVDVRMNQLACLHFDDPLQSVLEIEGAFQIRSSDYVETYTRADFLWLDTVLATLIAVPVLSARFTRSSDLTVCFADGRELFIPDDAFETWHYKNTHYIWHGGVGRVS